MPMMDDKTVQDYESDKLYDLRENGYGDAIAALDDAQRGIFDKLLTAAAHAWWVYDGTCYDDDAADARAWQRAHGADDELYRFVAVVADLLEGGAP